MKCMAWKCLIFSKIWIKRSHRKGTIPQLELYKSFSPKSRAKLPTKAELVVILLVVESANIPSVDSSLLVAASPSTGSGEAGIHSSLWRQIAFHSLCNCFTMANLTTSFRTFSMETRISLCCLEPGIHNVDNSSFWFVSWAVINNRKMAKKIPPPPVVCVPNEHFSQVSIRYIWRFTYLLLYLHCVMYSWKV